MFGIGPSELIIILIIALLVLGPKRLPELAAGLGKGLAEFRRATADINAELDDARRSLEEQGREAARAAQDDRRVARPERTPPKAVEPGASPATSSPSTTSPNVTSMAVTSPPSSPASTASPSAASPAAASQPGISRTGDKPADSDHEEPESDPKAPA